MTKTRLHRDRHNTKTFRGWGRVTTETEERHVKNTVVMLSCGCHYRENILLIPLTVYCNWKALTRQAVMSHTAWHTYKKTVEFANCRLSLNWSERSERCMTTLTGDKWKSIFALLFLQRRILCLEFLNFSFELHFIQSNAKERNETKRAVKPMM